MANKKNKTWAVHLLTPDGACQIAMVKANSIIEDVTYITFFDSSNNVSGKFKKSVVLGYATQDLED